MKDLQLPRSQKLPIKGGSPLSVGEISQLDIRKKRTGFFPKLATLFEGIIPSECPIKVKLFNDLKIPLLRYPTYRNYYKTTLKKEYWKT